MEAPGPSAWAGPPAGERLWLQGWGWSLCQGCSCLWCPPPGCTHRLKNKGNASKMGSRVGWCGNALRSRSSKGFSTRLWVLERMGEWMGGVTPHPAGALSGSSLRHKHPCGGLQGGPSCQWVRISCLSFPSCRAGLRLPQGTGMGGTGHLPHSVPWRPSLTTVVYPPFSLPPQPKSK